MQIGKFVHQSRIHMAQLSDVEFYLKLPQAILLYGWLEFTDWIKEVFA